jgi:hypothetical protein
MHLVTGSFRNGLTAALILLVSAGCAPSKVWTSQPAVQTRENPFYRASLTPLNEGGSAFVAFALKIENKTDNGLEIDWNKTRYLRNGRVSGGFVFEGINPEDVKNSTVPSEFVGPGKTFSKEIAPYRLVALAPIRDKTIAADQHGFSGGVLPEGENGILLVMRQNGNRIREKITVRIEVREVR